MPYSEFLWVDENVAHIAEHDVTTDEFEYVVRHPERRDVSHSTGLPCCWVRPQRADFCSAFTRESMPSRYIR